MTDSRKYEKLTESICLWIRETVEGAGMNGVVVGLSGGIDSSVTAALCSRALGRDSVLGMVMPCESSREDTEDGLKIAGFLGIPVKRIDLTPVLGAFIAAGELEDTDLLGRANIKARLRMTMEYAFARGRLVAGTGNLSETVTGYWTKWGDGAADFLPLAELWKDEVTELGTHLGLPEWAVARIPSAGLWKGQSDEGEMGVTYMEIKNYHTKGRDSVSKAAMLRIQELYNRSGHKRNPIPSFPAREILNV